MNGGYYCSKCGWATRNLPELTVVCRSCGAIGLRGFDNEEPVAVPCPVEGCTRNVWDDGGVNPGELQHKWTHTDFASLIRDRINREARPFA